MLSLLQSVRADQQLPASGDDDLQQVTTLQYCLVDNCTIKRINTGEKLDIVYTTDSLIVTTPTDSHTSVVIAKLENEVPCIKPNSMVSEYLILAITFPAVLLLVTVSGCIVVMHLIFKELRTVVGK